MWGSQKKDKQPVEGHTLPDMGPVEPEGAKPSKLSYFRWVLLAGIILYIFFTAYRVPILTELGRFLILVHPPVKSDLIVCLAGGNIERGLAAAESYQKGLAPRIFIAREEPPDGLERLRTKGVDYPETVDLMVILLQKLGVQRSAILTSDHPMGSTLEEARLIKDIVVKNNYRSLILVTSPSHSKRAWLTFRKVFEDQNIRILSLPTPYSEFRPEDWWKKRKYVRQVILEYQKLFYSALNDPW